MINLVMINDQYKYEEEAKLAADRDIFDKCYISCCSDDDFYDIDLNQEEEEEDNE